ncbi:ankyrin repeat domain-containing protein [Marinicella sediminis]|uniref:Ankyrin repeat domain-containing protein n=1 Tax=Marinicella sediminis TaxID=1792834 RepID=A0ABV7JAR9_9GAMM|nr:ankyrin repeat domain-containing protein [Marinicella sediminis]
MTKAKNTQIELLIASEKCDYEELKRLLKAGLKPSNIPEANGWSALRRTLLVGDTACVKLLLAYGADINEVDPQDGTTAIFDAAGECGQDILSLLIRNGADINSKDHDGKTPLMEAAYFEKTDNIVTLADNGADIDARDSGGCTALIIAAMFYREQAVRTLLGLGADPETADARGNSLRMWMGDPEQYKIS